MFGFRFIPDQTNFPFLELRKIFFVLSGILIILSAALLSSKELNFGIDFAGGIAIEIETESKTDFTQMRKLLDVLDLGEISLQEFGVDNHALLRIERQDGDGEAQQAAITSVKQALSAYPEKITYRRTESVGPTVGGELIQAGIIAIIAAIVLMLAYIWFRFELPFAIGAVLALVHDVALTLGMLSLTGFEVNLASVAAVLLIVGYSMNDTVVVYDRVRENLRKHKKLSLLQLLNRSVNETLSRTVITSATTLLALVALFIFGGEVIRGFSFTMIWGVIVGTYSSVFVAAALLIYLKPERDGKKKSEGRYADAERLQSEHEKNLDINEGLLGIDSENNQNNTDQSTSELKAKVRSKRKRTRRNRRNRKKK
tara:strand:- start:18503 stop:19612 length:1110 start_codon:yes stop_codon:yes gene_type:complete